MVVLALLVAGIFGFNYAVDPVALNRRFALGLDKKEVSFGLSYYAWRYPEYLHEPKSVIVLGDSRALSFPELIEESIGKPVYNFAFGGGTARDSVEAFWFAQEHGELESVYFGLGATLLNDAIAVERGQRDRELIGQPFRYYFSPFLTGASARVLAWNWWGVKGKGSTPPMDKEAFWDFQLNTKVRQEYGDYDYPEKYLQRLREVAAHCEEQGIDLVFFLPPTHVDLQAKRDEYGVESDYQRSLEVLKSLAPGFDWDYANELTEDRSRFKDPYHVVKNVTNLLVDEMVGGEPWLARHCPSPTRATRI